MVNRTRIEGGGYSNHGIITRYDQQAGCNIIVDVLFYKKLKNVSCEYDRVNG